MSVKYELNPHYEYGDLFYFNKQRIFNEVWYQRLGGHLNCKVVDFLKENKSIFNMIKNFESNCKNCDSSAAKFCRLPFLLVDRNCDYQLARIHCDLWGLTIVPFIHNFKNYVIFINECSHFTLLFSLRKKSFLFSMLLSFFINSLQLCLEFFLKKK